MSFHKLLDLYEINQTTVLFKHVECNQLLMFANYLDKLKAEIDYKYKNDEHLLEVLTLLKKVFFKLVSSLNTYNKVISKEIEQQVISKFIQMKSGYPGLFSKLGIETAKSFREVLGLPNNEMLNFLCQYINKNSYVEKKIAIVAKRAISIDERVLINSELRSSLKVNYFTETSFRKDLEVFDEVIYIGNPLYFGDYVKNTFKGRTVTFISYDIFTNTLKPKKIFEDINDSGAMNTIFKNILFGEGATKKINIKLEQGEVINEVVAQFIEQQKNEIEVYSQDASEAFIVHLENNRFLFAPKEAKIRVFSPYDPNNFIKQLNLKEIEEDQFIVIRNERDTKLIAEVADQHVLKDNATYYRELQNEWKNKLRFNVKRKGIGKVSEILMRKYNIKTASIASLRSWCNEYSICPVELLKILKALKYEDEKINNIYETMKKIQQAHIKAGKIISEKLTSELSNEIYKELQEKGYYTFMSREFNGVSFNIERIVSIDRSIQLITPYNLMRPMNVF